VLVGTTHQCFQNSTDTSFSGVAECKDAAGKIWSTHFSFSLDEHRKSLIYDDEMPRTLHDVQEIPNQLTKIAAAIREAAKELKEA